MKQLLIILFIFSINLSAQNQDPRWEKVQVIENEIFQFINDNISEIKLSKNEIKSIKKNARAENLTAKNIEMIKIATKKNHLRVRFFEKYPKKRSEYYTKLTSKNTKLPTCTNGDFESGVASYSFFSSVNWNHPGGFNVNLGSAIVAPFTPIFLGNPNLTITNTGFDPILGVIPEVFNGNHSLKLNLANGTQEDATILTRNFNSISQAKISLNFAVLLDKGHTATTDPITGERIDILNAFVRFEIFDNDINSIVDYKVITADSANGVLSAQGFWRYADWSCLDLDVSQSIGHNVTLRIIISDCTDTIHDGILYLDDICNEGSECDESFFGDINLLPQGINCPTESFQVCGTFDEALNTVNTTITLKIKDSLGNIISTLTNPTINNTNDTFCFTVNPTDFGTNPNGNFEFVSNATFTNSNGSTTFAIDESSNNGADVSFNDCITCDDLNGNFNASISTNGNLIVSDFELFDSLQTTHEWYVLSRTDNTSTNYTPVYSGYSTALGPLVLVNNAQADVYYTVIHKVYSDECEETCESKTLFYSNGKNKMDNSDVCCLALEYWPNGPADINDLITFNAVFDATISLSGTLNVFDFEAFDYANAVHSWTIYSSTNYIGPYTTLVYNTNTTGSGPIDLINNLQSGLYYGIKHEVTTDCSTVCDDGVLFYSTGKSNKMINNPERVSLCCNTFDDLVTLTSPTDDVLSSTVENYDTYFNIIANNKIETNANATYKANETIVLSNGFHAKHNSLFHAYILSCDYVSSKENKNGDNENGEALNKKSDVEFIKIYPNPTKNYITIESSKEVYNWVITDTYGKSYFTGNTTEIIDMSNLPNGIYLLKAILKDGNIVMKKVIKN